ncbi:MAG: lysostaphin resistance A-like protein [Halodesulfurarchaeum sp.]
MSGEAPWHVGGARSTHPGYAVGGAVLAALGGIVAAFVVTALVGGILAGLGISLAPVPQFGLLFIAGAVGLGGTGILYLRVRGLPVWEYVGAHIPSVRDLLWAGAGYVGALSLIFAAGIVLTILNIVPDTANQAAKAGLQHPELLLWLVPMSFVVIAPAEELLFRGVVQGRLREAFSPPVAITATAALFATVHYFSLTGGSGARFIAIAILFLPSLVFGYVYERTANLVVPILIHGAYNATLVLLVYISLKVMETAPIAA